MAVQERYDDDLLAMPGVAGTAVGLGVDGRPVVKVFVTGAHVTGLPVRLDGHALAVEVTGAFRALDGDDGTNPRAPFSRPVPIGVSTGQVDVTAGTIGARVVRGGEVFASATTTSTPTRTTPTSATTSSSPAGWTAGGIRRT